MSMWIAGKTLFIYYLFICLLLYSTSAVIDFGFKKYLNCVFAVNMNQKLKGWLLPREISDFCSLGRLVIMKRSLERSCFITVLHWIAGMTSIVVILVKI